MWGLLMLGRGGSQFHRTGVQKHFCAECLDPPLFYLLIGYSDGRYHLASWRHKLETRIMSSLPLQHLKQRRNPLTNLPLQSVQWLQWLALCIVTKTVRVLSSVDAICIYIGLSSVYICNMHILAMCDVPTMLLLLATWLCWTSVQHAFMLCVMG